MTFKPLLAEPAEDIEFPVYASVKIDGIRACMLNGRLVSRRLKPIPNTYIRRTLEAIPSLEYCDGELLTFTNGKMDDFNTIQSKVMTEAGKPEFYWYMFDHFKYPEHPFTERMVLIPKGQQYTRVVTQILIHSEGELDAIEARAVSDGWEGLMIRSPQGYYKYGRSTAKQGILLKVVRRFRAEAIITGTYERMHNANEATIDERGYTERSSHKDNKHGRGDLGGLDLLWNGMVSGKLFPSIALPAAGGVEFSCGTGYDDALRAHLWEIRETLPGKIVTFEFRGIGVNMRPRFPAFIGFRND